MAGLLLHLEKVVDVVGVEDEGLFADDVAAKTQAVADEGVVGVVGCADGEPLDGVGCLLALGTEAVEEFVLGEEKAVGKGTVKPSDTVEVVEGGHKVVARVGDGFEVAGCNVACCTYECKVLHSGLLNVI